jgi:hypothetical protein
MMSPDTYVWICADCRKTRGITHAAYECTKGCRACKKKNKNSNSN